MPNESAYTFMLTPGTCPWCVCRSALALRPYTLLDLSGHLREALPPGWEWPGPRSPLASTPATVSFAVTLSAALSAPAALAQLGACPWDNGSVADSPSPWWLAKLWRLIEAMLHMAEEWKVWGQTNLK